MPKRSNEFQQLIHYIYTQLTPSGTTVTESFELKERNSNATREIDILIEQDIANIKMRIAVECRDRSRKSDIEWIDGLIGKYKDLDIHKVVAVSRSGFSKDAIDKAAKHGIETKTIRECLDIDWPQEFIKYEMRTLGFKLEVINNQIEIEPEFEEKIEYETSVTNETGELFSTLHAIYKEYFYNLVIPEYHRRILEDYEAIKTILDKLIVIEVTVENVGLYLVSSNKLLHKIFTLIYQVIPKVFTKDIEVENYVYDQALITTGILNVPEQGIAYKATISQVAGRNEWKLFINPIKSGEKHDQN